MADDIRAVFASVKTEAKDFSTALWKCCEKIYNELPQDYEADIDPELQITFLTNKLKQAVETLCDGLDNPTLILATTGTTSSGKSTLVNLLCGAELMPRAVQEMSAGVVTIEYSEQKAVKIEETAGATWECGTWHNVSNEDIYDRLDGVMKAYLKHKAVGDSRVACPQSTVYYPFRLIAEPNLLNLPESTTVKIMDLPGLAHVGDEGNAEVIRRSREALCLVTYNSAETDKEKVSSLLQEVVEQVKELGGSPARMLFVLNRIDVFRSDKNWQESEELFCNKTEQDIRQKLKDNLGEYESEINEIKIVKLSSLPALLSLEMVNGSNEEKIKASEKLFDFFKFLIPKDVRGDLSGLSEKWTDHDRKRVHDAIWLETNAEAFHQHLKQHIQNEYPQLIIPQLIKSFKDNAAFKLVEWAAQTTSATINGSEKRYQLECERIKDIETQLNQNIQVKGQALKDPFGKIKKILESLNEQDNIGDIQELLTQLEKMTSSMVSMYDDSIKESSSHPFSDWERELNKAIGSITNSILSALKDGKSIVSNKAFEYASPRDVSVLEILIQGLTHEGYREHAGQKFQARTQEEKEKLETLNKGLNALSYKLESIVNDVAKKVLDREMGRVKDAMEKLFIFHLESLEKSTANIAPDLGINFPQSELINVDFKAQPKFSFEGGFVVLPESYTEEVAEKIGTKRFLFFFRKDVYETRVEERSSDNANIPSFADLGRGWNVQKDHGEIGVFKQISKWWIEQLDEFDSGIGSFQTAVIKRYQDRLNRANRDTRIDYKSKMEVWHPLKEEAELVAAKIAQLGAEWKNQ